MSKREARYGKIVKSSVDNVSVVSPEDFSRHIYCIGGTGTGKTTLIRIIAKHLEITNKNGEFPNAFIYIDPKGDDSFKFVQQCEPDTISEGKVHFLDPSLTRFSVNPLELPSYHNTEREEVVSRYIGYFMDIVKEWYSQTQSYVQMERIFRTFLHYLYQNNDAPTFLDLHDLIVRLQDNGEEELQLIYKALGKPDNEMQSALSSIANLSNDAFAPLLNRIEQFTTDPVLKRIFSARHSTVDFNELATHGHYTIVRISALNMPHHVQPLAMMAFILKLWFTVQERAAIMHEKDRTQIVLAIDEFQIVKDLQVIPLILSQARSYGLGLILAHQTTAQIFQELLEIITGNCATQLSGRISGIDANRIARIWDPRFSKDIADQLATQQDFRWSIRVRAKQGEEQGLPLQFWLFKPPMLKINDNELYKFIETQKARYGIGVVEKSILKQQIDEKGRWMRQLSVELPDYDKWKIMLAVRTQAMNVTQITKATNARSRDDISKLCYEMHEQGLLSIARSHKVADKIEYQYIISEYARNKYFNLDFSIIGKADDIHEVVASAQEYYLHQGNFVALANQNIKERNDRTDLAVYDYQNDKAISVEIESISEVDSHPEQVRYNMQKWQELGFEECHVWSKNTKIQDIYNSLDADLQNKVKLFVV